MKPNKRQLAEFDRFWDAECGPFLRGAHGETAGQVKARILGIYTWFWEGAGCPKRFIPAPMPHRQVDGPRADRDSKIADFDQNILPNRDWT